MNFSIDIFLLVTLALIFGLIFWFYRIVSQEIVKINQDREYKFRKRRIILPGVLSALLITSPLHLKTSNETHAVLQSYTSPTINVEGIEIRRHQPRVYTPPDNREEIERLMSREFNYQKETGTEEKK